MVYIVHKLPDLLHIYRSIPIEPTMQFTIEMRVCSRWWLQCYLWVIVETFCVLTNVAFPTDTISNLEIACLLARYRFIFLQNITDARRLLLALLITSLAVA